MICYICLQRGWKKTTAGGTCVECSSFVCRTPSSRPDQVVHAYRCTCTCGDLVCELDAIAHSTGHQGAAAVPPACFPQLTLIVAPRAGQAAAELLKSNIRIEHDAREDDMRRMLATVAPGSAAFDQAVTAAETTIYRHAAGGKGLGYAAIRSAFFTDQRLAKIVSLAARVIAETAVQLPEFRSEDHALDNVIGASSPVDAESLLAFLLARWLPDGSEVPDPLAIPMKPFALARWLLEEDSTATPATEMGAASMRANY